MKNIVRIQLAFSLVLLCFIPACYFPFHETEENFEPYIETTQKKITANFYNDFGKIIATDSDQILVSSYETIHVFKMNSSEIELIQTIGFKQTSGIISMIVNQSELYVGLAEGDGTGVVYIYTRNGDLWELSQKIRKGISQDNFGCAIDIEGEMMVIGANAVWTSCVGLKTCEGRLYVFQKRGDVWEERQVLQAGQPEIGDWFGTTVAICGNLILAGSPMQPLHLYRFNGEWELLGTEEIYTYKIAHSTNNFIINGENAVRAFLLEPDGSFSENKIHALDNLDIAWSGEIIEMQDSLAIVDTESTECYLLKYGNRQWELEKTFSPDPGEYCTFNGMAISDKYAIIGGINVENSQLGYVYFRDL